MEWLQSMIHRILRIVLEVGGVNHPGELPGSLWRELCQIALMTSPSFRCLKLDEINLTSKYSTSLFSWNREELQIAWACKQPLFYVAAFTHRIIILHGFHRERERQRRPQPHHGAVCVLAQRVRGCSLHLRPLARHGCLQLWQLLDLRSSSISTSCSFRSLLPFSLTAYKLLRVTIPTF